MSGAGNLALLGRGIGGLVVVLVLIALLARFARRRGGKGDGTGLRVVERLGLSREANLAVVEVANRTLLLGVTAQGVTMLAHLDGSDPDDEVNRHARPPAQAGQAAQLADAEVRLASVVALSSTTADATAPADAAPSRVQPTPSTQLDLTGLERDIARPRSASPVGTDQPVAPEPTAAVPNGVALDDYPDLASALRAAGRTTTGTNTDACAPTGTAGTTAPPDASSSGTQPSTAPRTRAEARAQGALTSSSGARKSRQKPAKPGELKVTRIDDGATPGGNGPAGGRVQASGSVLSPRTWRQGVDALRELTVRRG